MRKRTIPSLVMVMLLVAMLLSGCNSNNSDSTFVESTEPIESIDPEEPGYPEEPGDPEDPEDPGKKPEGSDDYAHEPDYKLPSRREKCIIKEQSTGKFELTRNCPSSGSGDQGQNVDVRNYEVVKKDGKKIGVKDRDTGLIWQLTTGGDKNEMSWNAAKNYCSNLELGGYDDWQLPRVSGLLSIIEWDSGVTYTTSRYFPNCHNGWYWAAEYSWAVRFLDGFATKLRSRQATVRCARRDKKTTP